MKIAILGAESTHANDFAIKMAPKDGKVMLSDVELVGVYADKELADSDMGVRAILKNSSCQCVTDQCDAFVEQVDGVMITSRHGSKHLKYARPYLEKGIPVWIDKPICCSIEDVLELMKLADKHSVSVCGGSSLVFSKEIRELAAYVKENRGTVCGGHITAPIHMDSQYDGFWFYASHAVQMMLEIFGADVRRVTAVRERNAVRACYEYDDLSVSVYFGTGYTVTLYKDDYHAELCQVSTGDCEEELKEFLQVIGNGNTQKSRKEWIAPVFLIDATKRSYEQNRTIEIMIPEV